MNPTNLLDSTDKDMLDAKYWEISMYKTALEGRKGELVDGDLERDRDLEVKISNKLRRDAFLVFRALCKLLMKSLPQEATSDPIHMWGKTVDELHTPEQAFERFSRYTNIRDGLHRNSYRQTSKQLPANIEDKENNYVPTLEQLPSNFVEGLEVTAGLEGEQIDFHQDYIPVAQPIFTLNGEGETSPIFHGPQPGLCPPPAAFLGPKCALWDCSRPAQGTKWCQDYCSNFHVTLALNEGAPGMRPVLRPGGIDLKDGPLFAALSAKTQEKSVGIPECEGAATAKSPWNAHGMV
jgi:hypothetical protein